MRPEPLVRQSRLAGAARRDDLDEVGRRVRPRPVEKRELLLAADKRRVHCGEFAGEGPEKSVGDLNAWTLAG